LDADVQQLDHHKPARWTRAHRRVRGRRVGGGHRAQLRVFPGTAHRPAGRLHRHWSALHVPGRVTAQLRSDSRRGHGGHHRVVHSRPVVRAREPGMAGGPRPHW